MKIIISLPKRRDKEEITCFQREPAKKFQKKIKVKIEE